MDEQFAANNPYMVGDGMGNGRLFYGRKNVLNWLQKSIPQTTKEDKVSTPIILHGPEKIGKTTLLNQIEQGILGDKYFPIYIDLNDIALDSNNTFLWDIAGAAYRKLQRKNITLPKLRQTDFIANAGDAFREKFLFPATKAVNNANNTGYATGQKLLILFDNLQVLMQSNKKGGVSSVATYSIHRLCFESNLAACLFAFEDSEQHRASEQAVFEDARMWEIGLLSREDTIQMIRQPISYLLVSHVANYIFEVTQGQPYYTQKICSELYERQQKYGLQQITVADVTAVLRANPDIQKASGVESQLPTYQISSGTGDKKTIQSTYRLNAGQKRWLVIGMGLVLLVTAVFILSPLLIRNNPRQTVQAEETVLTPAVTVIPQIVIATQIQTVVATTVLTATPEPAALVTEAAVAPPATDTPAPSPTPAAPEPTAAPSVLPDLYVRPQDEMEMILIPAGTFTMGLPTTIVNIGDGEIQLRAGLDELPAHEVTLDQFYIDKYEVNVGQYARFLNRLGGYAKACDGIDCAWPTKMTELTYLIEQEIADGTLAYTAAESYEKYPINHVTWYGANLYCQSVGGRLPTEAEWEYAARGTDGRIFPWGNLPDPAKAIYGRANFNALQPVDTMSDGASPFGVFGMAGSMWEWVSDWYSETYYQESPAENPQGPVTGIFRVNRGGAWPANNEVDRIRTANRNALAPDFISSTVGFRCAMTP